MTVYTATLSSPISNLRICYLAPGVFPHTFLVSKSAGIYILGALILMGSVQWIFEKPLKPVHESAKQAPQDRVRRKWQLRRKSGHRSSFTEWYIFTSNLDSDWIQYSFRWVRNIQALQGARARGWRWGGNHSISILQWTSQKARSFHLGLGSMAN